MTINTTWCWGKEGTAVGDGVNVRVGLAVAVDVDVGLGAAVLVGTGVRVGVAVGVAVETGIAVSVGMSVPKPSSAMPACGEAVRATSRDRIAI
jgi:hypothetical protein